jgi:SAM-dependent methyltransferase
MRLNSTPLEDQFVKAENKTLTQPVYPLDLAICNDCGYVHLPYVVNLEASYSDYVYESNVTVGLRRHYDDYAKEIVKDFGISEGALVIDLGSNDGSMLDSFRRIGMNILGVEPAEAIAKQANDSGLSTINEFFTDEIASRILKDYGFVNIVTANYMYANIDNVIAFTKSVASLLKRDGIFVVQTGYHPEQMKIMMFDYIYHEHFSYFTVEVLKNIFSSCGLELIQVNKTSPKGGSIRAVGQLKNGLRPIDSSVEQLINEEHSIGIRDSKKYKHFALDIQNAKLQIIEKLRKLKSEGKRIVGYGASHSTTTLTYHFELAGYMEYLVDDNQLKHERYSPGYHLQVYSPEKLYEDMPDYVIILGWQHLNSIINRHKAFIQSGGKFLVPLPKLKVIEEESYGK